MTTNHSEKRITDMNMSKYYNQLIGAKIIGFHFENVEYALSEFPVFELELGGQIVRLAISQDEECNGGGFGVIEVVS